jgi:hypothetical protein
VPAGRWVAVLGGTRIAKSGVWGMRHLLLAATMLVFGLGITVGTASVLQDVNPQRGRDKVRLQVNRRHQVA